MSDEVAGVPVSIRWRRRIPGEPDERRVFDLRWALRRGARALSHGLRGVQPLCYDTAINISEWRPPTSLYASWNRHCAFRGNTKGDLVATLLSRAFPDGFSRASRMRTENRSKAKLSGHLRAISQLVKQLILNPGRLIFLVGETFSAIVLGIF